MATLGELIVTVGAQIGGFTSAMKEVQDKLGEIGDTAKESLDHFDGIIKKLGEVAAAAGIATGAIEIAKDALETFAKAQDVQTSFALLTGSTTAATDAFDGLKEMATNLAIPFEQLISVSQRLAPQFGVGTQAMADVLTGAADAARATGNSFDTVAQSLDRIALSGTITTRQMNSLQISIQDIADAMGTSVAEATAKIKKGGQSAQEDMTVILAAISEKYGGAAEAMSTGLTGLFTNMKNELGFVSDDLGKALAPLAEDLIAGIKDMEPTLKGIADGAVAAVTGFTNMGAALSSLLPDFVKVIFSGPSMIALGTAVGFVGQTLATLVDTLHAAAIQAGDILAGNFSQLVTDWKAGGKVLTDDLNTFGDIAKKGDELSKTFGDMKIPVFGDTVANAGAATTAMSNMAEMAKALKEATKDLAMADKDHAEYLKASYVPAITTVEDAESKLHDARLVYLAADQAEQTTRQALLEAQKNKTADLITIEATLKDQSKTTKDAHIAYTEALKDQQLAKTTLTTATKDILAAEADIAAALKANYIPALLDHKTALDNIVAAEANQKAAIEAVGVAEVNLQNAMPKPGSPGDPVAIKAAEDALATTRQNLKDAVVKLTEAHKDEVTSLNLLQSVQKDIDATDKLLIANKKLLLPATRDMVAAIKDYDSALADARTADQALRDAEQDLINVRNSGPTGQQLKDALDKEKAAKDAVTLTNAKLSDATRTLTTDFKANRDTIDELTRHTGDWTESQKVAAAALADMGIKSGQALDDLAKKAADDFEAISSSESTSLEERRQANIKFLQDKLDADVQNGRDISAAQQLDLAKLKQQETDYRTDSVTQWATLYTTIDGDVKSFTQSAIATLITGKGSFKDEVVTMLDNIAIAVVDTFLKKATDAIAQFIAGALADLLSGKGLGGVLDALKNIGTAISGVFKGIGGVGGAIGGAAQGIGAVGSGAIGDIVGTGDTLAGIGQTASGATGAVSSAVSGAMSGVMGIVGGIGSAVSAISGVIGNFQMAHQETSLNAIELNTRLTAIAMLGAWKTGDQETIYTYSKRTMQAADDFAETLKTTIHGDLVGIWNAVGAGGGASTAATAVADQSMGIINELKNIESFNWGTLHADLVGIWNEATGIKDNIIAMATKLASSTAGAATAVLGQSPSLSYDSSKMVGNDVASASVVATLNRMAATSGAAGIIDLSSVTTPLKSLVDLVTAGFGRMVDFGTLLHADLLGLLDLGKSLLVKGGTQSVSNDHDDLVGIQNALKDIQSFNWGTLHADLVGIWGDLNNDTSVMIARLESVIAAVQNSGTWQILADVINGSAKMLGDILLASFGRLFGIVADQSSDLGSILNSQNMGNGLAQQEIDAISAMSGTFAAVFANAFGAVAGILNGISTKFDQLTASVTGALVRVVDSFAILHTDLMGLAQLWNLNYGLAGQTEKTIEAIASKCDHVINLLAALSPELIAIKDAIQKSLVPVAAPPVPTPAPILPTPTPTLATPATLAPMPVQTPITATPIIPPQASIIAALNAIDAKLFTPAPLPPIPKVVLPANIGIPIINTPIPVPSTVLPTPQIRIFLDMRELAQSYCVYLSQSGTVAPAAA